MHSFWLACPFLGLLLSMALMPVWWSQFWHKFMPGVVAFWVLITIGLWAQFAPSGIIFSALGRTLYHEYLPFVVLITALYTISSGIWMDIQAPSHPVVNVAILIVGTCLAGWIGTMGASMILIRPFLLLNRERTHKTHHLLFFIFLVGNVGGVLSPLGDPPLFMGFLEGVTFFWPLTHFLCPWGYTSVLLLLIFCVLEIISWKREAISSERQTILSFVRIHVRGYRNFFFLGMVIAITLIGGVLKHKTWTWSSFSFTWFEGFNELLLGFVVLWSWTMTAPSIREHNAFTWEPVREIGVLFIGIFVTLLPVTETLHHHGSGALFQWVQYTDGTWNPHAFFWLSGLLSAFLDNAPTYLLFFHLAGGDAHTLMTQDATILKALSLGSVFMGALTYIGNAPNMMIRSIAQRRHLDVPSFLGYLGYALIILGPVFYIVSQLCLH